MKTVSELAASSTVYDRKIKTARKALQREECRDLLPCEAQAFEAAVVGVKDANKGNPVFDKHYPRIDLVTALSLRKEQKGCPIPVPRFVAINTNGTRAEVNSILGENNTARSGNSSTLLDPLGAELNQHVEKKAFHYELYFRFYILSVLLILAGVSVAFYSVGSLTASSSILQRAVSVLHVVTMVGALVTLLAFCLSVPSAFDRLRGPWYKQVSATLSYTFKGLVPEAIRKLARDRGQTVTGGAAFSTMHIVCEAEHWDYKIERDSRTLAEIFPAPKPDPDPLLVGEFNGAYYLVAKFDMTPSEEWLAREMKE